MEIDGPQRDKKFKSHHHIDADRHNAFDKSEVVLGLLRILAAPSGWQGDSDSWWTWKHLWPTWGIWSIDDCKLNIGFQSWKINSQNKMNLPQNLPKKTFPKNLCNILWGSAACPVFICQTCPGKWRRTSAQLLTTQISSSSLFLLQNNYKRLSNIYGFYQENDMKSANAT